MTDRWLKLKAAHADARQAELRALEALSNAKASGEGLGPQEEWRVAQQKTAEAWYALHEHACRGNWDEPATRFRASFVLGALAGAREIAIGRDAGC